ncbi:MAG TPA: AraC family transcriptional regulator [Opitutaceae bacterium]|nr:AraC family transcriptional regulator [Opitutaceae bacterium]
MSRQVVEARRFYLPPSSWRNSSEPAVICGGWERCSPEYEIRRPGFPHLTLEFIVAGRGTLQLCGRTYTLRRGTVFAYGAGMPHVFSTDSKDRLAKYFVNFAGKGAEEAMRAAGIPPGVCHGVTAVDEIQAAFEQLLFAGRRTMRTAARITALHGRIILLLMSETRVTNAAHANRALETFLRCRKVIEENFASFRTAEEAAAACYVAPVYLSRIFRRFAGVPAYQFLLRLKMNHAATLMDHRHLLVREAADALKIDPFQFSRAFKRVYGVSPQAFIRSRRSGVEAE